MRDSKAKEILNNSFGYIIVAITCVLYVLTSIFVLDATGKTAGQIVGESIIAFLMGVSINYLLSIQGILNGMQTDELKATMSLYASTVIKISVIINKLGAWCHKKNKLTYERQRTKLLARAGLRYSDCFEEDGTAKIFVFSYDKEPTCKTRYSLKEKLSRQRERIRVKAVKRKNKENKKDYLFKRKCYWQAVKLKLTELYPNDLTSEGGKQDDPNYYGQTIDEYILQSNSKTIIAKVCLALIFGVYGFKLIENFSWTNLIWTGFQICTFLCFGLIKMRMSYMFITNSYRGRIIKKIDNLEEFDADTDRNTVQVEEIKDKGEKENVNQ